MFLTEQREFRGVISKDIAREIRFWSSSKCSINSFAFDRGLPWKKQERWVPWRVYGFLKLLYHLSLEKSKLYLIPLYDLGTIWLWSLTIHFSFFFNLFFSIILGVLYCVVILLWFSMFGVVNFKLPLAFHIWGAPCHWVAYVLVDFIVLPPCFFGFVNFWLSWSSQIC